MDKSPSLNANNNIRKYVLIDTPVFSKGMEGAKFLFKRDENASVSFAIKKFFLTLPMRAEGKKQIVQIFGSEEFQKIQEAQTLLEKIKKLYFWQGVNADAVGDVLAQAALRGIDAFPQTENNSGITRKTQSLRASLNAALPDLEKKYLSDPDNLEKEIQWQLEKNYAASGKGDKSIYGGLNEFISHMKDPAKECSLNENRKINGFLEKIRYMEKNDKNFPSAVSEKIMILYESYVERFEAAKNEQSYTEIKKIKYPDLQTAAMIKAQHEMADQMHEALGNLLAFKNYPQALDAFIDFFKNPDDSFSMKRVDDYAQFLNLFYENIEQLNPAFQSICLNVADRLEGFVQRADKIDFRYFNYHNVKNQDIRKLMKSLTKHTEPSSSLLSFLDYLKGGNGTINALTYWKLLQLVTNQNKRVREALNLGQEIIFNALQIKLANDLRSYAELKNKLIPEKLLSAAAKKPGSMPRQQALQQYITSRFAAISNENLTILQNISQERTQFLEFAKTLDYFPGTPEKLYEDLRADLNRYLAMTSNTIPL